MKGQHTGTELVCVTKRTEDNQSVFSFRVWRGAGLCRVLVVAHRISHLHCGMWDGLVAACRIF